MDHQHFARRVETLERAAYGAAIRSAIRLSGLFRKQQEGRQRVAVLRLPKDADMKEYEIAAGLLIRETPALADLMLAVPKIDRRRVLDLEPIFAELRSGADVAIVWPADHDVPTSVALAADRIVDVSPVRPFHLVSAAKAIHGQSIGIGDAGKMLAHPPARVFAAFRPGRPPAEILRRLEETKEPPAPEDARPRLGDMIGYGDAKAWALSLAEDLRAWKAGRLPWSDVDRGLLLSGPPGTGKTLFAGALAHCCEAGLVATSVGRWQSAGHLGDVLAAMRRSFADAVAARPCILFIDEVEGVGDRARFAGREYEIYWTQVVNLLLELIDGVDRLEGVVVVGATNYPDRIDPALRRAGRLDRHVAIGLPDLEDRRELARLYCGGALSEHDLDRVASATTGFTGADFEKTGRDVRRLARKAGREVTVEDVFESLPPARRIVGGERRMIAIHEAAHAVVGHRLGVGHLQTVAVPWEVREPQSLGYAFFEMDEHQLWERQGLLDRIATTLAGRAAEEEIIGTAFDGAGAAEGADLHVASDVATMMEVRLGMGEGLAFYNLQTVEQRDRVRQNNPEVATRVERLLRQEMERSRSIVREFRSAIERIAGVLVKEAVVEGEDVRRILRECRR